MRWLDRLLGVPLCWLVSLFHRRGWRSSAQPRTILVTKFFGLGSVLLSVPFLQNLHSCFPAAQLIYLSFSSNRELLSKLPVRCRAMTIDTSSLVSFVRDTIAVVIRLRRAQVDFVFDLEFFSKYSTLMSVLSGANVRVGYDLPAYWRRGNLTHPVQLDRTKHVMDVFAQQLDVLGIPYETPASPPQLEPTLAEQASMLRKLRLHANGVEMVAVNINAGSTSLERRWPPERFLDVVERLLDENPKRRFYFTGSADERCYVQAALEARSRLSKHVVNCAGLLTLGEMLALLARCRFLLTSDSGPMHLAAAVGTPVVALFGPESPQFYGPSGPAVVIYRALKCSPCLNIYNAKMFTCPYNAQCMREISVEDVLQAISHLLEGGSPRDSALSLSDARREYA